MLVNVVAKLTNVLGMKLENDAWVNNFHNTHCCCFSLSYICQPLPNELIFIKCVLIVHIRPAFYRNVNTNASNLYKCLTTTTNALPTIRMACNWLQIRCEWLQIFCEFAFLANFRSMFLIFVKPQNRA